MNTESNSAVLVDINKFGRSINNQYLHQNSDINYLKDLNDINENNESRSRTSNISVNVTHKQHGEETESINQLNLYNQIQNLDFDTTKEEMHIISTDQDQSDSTIKVVHKRKQSPI
mmetsp:Transcript_25581/g.22725  ORF Transcript_25581/g.22725 Transcript_25581/m.22725 type:complete len:116 (+) Transcript_25581:183-530(+)